MFIKIDDTQRVIHEVNVYDSLTQDEKDELGPGYVIDSLGNIPNIAGKEGFWHYNPSTGEKYIIYEDRPLTKDEEIETLKARVDAQDIALAQILGM